jgi:hypothetical protein
VTTRHSLQRAAERSVCGQRQRACVEATLGVLSVHWCRVVNWTRRRSRRTPRGTFRRASALGYACPTTELDVGLDDASSSSLSQSVRCVHEAVIAERLASASRRRSVDVTLRFTGRDKTAPGSGRSGGQRCGTRTRATGGAAVGIVATNAGGSEQGRGLGEEGF